MSIIKLKLFSLLNISKSIYIKLTKLSSLFQMNNVSHYLFTYLLMSFSIFCRACYLMCRGQQRTRSIVSECSRYRHFTHTFVLGALPFWVIYWQVEELRNDELLFSLAQIAPLPDAHFMPLTERTNERQKYPCLIIR